MHMDLVKYIFKFVSIPNGMMRSRKMPGMYSRQQNYSNTCDNTCNFFFIWSPIFIIIILFINSIKNQQIFISQIAFTSVFCLRIFARVRIILPLTVPDIYDPGEKRTSVFLCKLRNIMFYERETCWILS